MRLPSLLLLVVAITSGCATYRDELNRGQLFYTDNQYEKALAVWRLLESDIDSLNYDEQVRYAFFRGMTDYRLGFRADARHWLSLAKAVDSQHRGGLTDDTRAELEVTLGELNRQVWSAAKGIPIPEPVRTGTAVSATSPASAGPTGTNPVGVDSPTRSSTPNQ
jgi:hypothetical protein